MAIGGVLPYRQPDMQGFQLLAGVLQDRQRQQQQEDFYKRMQALESDFSKGPEDYMQDISDVEDRMSRVAAVKDTEDPAFAAERMKALSAERRNLMSQMQQREGRGEIEDYMVRAEALKNKYGPEIDKFNPFEDRYRRGQSAAYRAAEQKRKQNVQIKKYFDVEKKRDVVEVKGPAGSEEEIEAIYARLKKGGTSDPEINKLKEGYLQHWKTLPNDEKEVKVDELNKALFPSRLRMVKNPVQIYGRELSPGWEQEKIPLKEYVDQLIIDEIPVSSRSKLEKLKKEAIREGLPLSVLDGLQYRDERSRKRTYYAPKTPVRKGVKPPVNPKNPGKDLHKGEVITPEVVARYKEWAKKKAPGNKEAQKRWFNWRLKNEGWVRK